MGSLCISTYCWTCSLLILVHLHVFRTHTTTMNTLANVYILFVICRPGFSRAHQSGEGEGEQQELPATSDQALQGAREPEEETRKGDS